MSQIASNPLSVISSYESIKTTLKPLHSGYNLADPLTRSVPVTLAKQTGQNTLPQDKLYPSTTVLCPAEIVQVVNFVLVIPLLRNRIKGKETTIAEPLLEVSSHMLPSMHLAASERQIRNHSGMQSVW